MAIKKILKTVLQDITDKLKITSLLVSHDPLDTLSWANEILVLQNGKIIQQGAPQEIYHRPVNEYAASLFGSYNLIPAGKAVALEDLLRISMPGKSLFIRPECFRLTHNAENAIAGKVKTMHYFGSYDELEVQLNKLTIQVKTVGFRGKKGDKVWISVGSEDVWFI